MIYVCFHGKIFLVLVVLLLKFIIRKNFRNEKNGSYQKESKFIVLLSFPLESWLYSMQMLFRSYFLLPEPLMYSA